MNSIIYRSSWLVLLLALNVFIMGYINNSAALQLNVLDTTSNNPVLINNSVVLTVPNYFELNEHSNWKRLENYIQTTPYKTIILIWAGYGGFETMGVEFINSVINARNLGHVIIFQLKGMSASMHAVSVCYGNNYIFNGGFLYFHDAFYRNPITKTKIYEEDFNSLNECVRRGIISNKEYNLIMIQHKAIIVMPNGHYIEDDEK